MTGRRRAGKAPFPNDVPGRAPGIATFDEQREIPISEQLERALRAHVRARPSATDAVFRYATGNL